MIRLLAASALVLTLLASAGCVPPLPAAEASVTPEKDRGALISTRVRKGVVERLYASPHTKIMTATIADRLVGEVEWREVKPDDYWVVDIWLSMEYIQLDRDFTHRLIKSAERSRSAKQGEDDE